ncbi:MAG TPA: PRC-barrel domain-containing protein, partial [Steroidobacter sp.]|nr:PRC-barrel domain-containing protein [Steroidobacter sp.]
MNRLHAYIYSLVAGLGFVSLALAEERQEPPDPRPSTSPTEGTAADQTPPGHTPTRPVEPGDAQVDPQPSTSPAEGTAADRTPPGRTTTTSDQSKTTEALLGAAVVTPANEPLGKVVDVVFDTTGQPAFVVIDSRGEAAAVPYP